MKYLLLLSLTVSSLVCIAEINYPDAKPNVPYSSVLKLEKNEPDKIIHYGQMPLQFGELWLPQTQKTPAPLIIFIHGGCWLNAYDIKHTHALSTSLKQKGFAVWSLEYRRTGDDGGGWPGSYADIIRGIEFVKNLNDRHIDTSNIILAGHSAGGHLALVAGASETIKPLISGIVGLAAISDLKAYSEGNNSCQKATLSFMGGNFEEKKDEYLNADPRSLRLHKNTTLIHGDQDSIVPVRHTVESGLRSNLVKDAGHFDLIHPGTDAWRAFIDELKRMTDL